MSKTSLPTAFGVAIAFALSVMSFAPAHAQDAGNIDPSQQQGGDPAADRFSGLTRAAPPLATSGPAAAMAAQRIATGAGLSCQVVEANVIGQTTDRQRVTYEAACATGPGYILVNSVPPEAKDCVLLAGQADADRAANAAADVGVQCVIPRNTDIARVIGEYAAEAGIACTVDQGASIGRTSDDTLIYEVGCNGLDGYRIEKAASGWTKTECAVIVTQNSTCRFTTADEQAATLKARLVGSDAAACDVTQSRYVGTSAGDTFYEAKCGAGNGVIARFAPDFTVRQVFPCEAARRIGGGCRLTVVPEAPAAQ